jgi:hypothetical protein
MDGRSIFVTSITKKLSNNICSKKDTHMHTKDGRGKGFNVCTNMAFYFELLKG